MSDVLLNVGALEAEFKAGDVADIESSMKAVEAEFTLEALDTRLKAVANVGDLAIGQTEPEALLASRAPEALAAYPHTQQADCTRWKGCA